MAVAAMDRAEIGAGAAFSGPFYVNWQSGRAGPDAAKAVTLRPQSLAVLKLLFESAGQVVTKDRLVASIWQDVAVTDDSLVQCITEIRKAIGDSDRTIIKTLSKRGYILDLPNGTHLVDDEPPQTSGKASPSASSMTEWRLAAGILLLGFAAVAALLWRPAAKPVELPAIAVLPFVNMGTDPKGDKFADMMTEDVITDLSHAKDFAVIARNSSEVYKGKAVDIRAVGKDLHVNYVLEGSVEALPGRVRATVQLIDAATNTHVWSDRLERQGDDVFAVEADITNRIATSITGHDKVASNNQRRLIRRKAPSEWSAYDAYQAGLEASHQMSKESVPKAEENFTKAIAIDPNFARAHVGLAWVNFLKLLYGGSPPEQALATMMAEAQKAANLDPDDGEAHAALAQGYSLVKDYGQMEAETGRALALAPNNADILILTSMFLVQAGKSDQALANVNTALNLNPSYPFWYNTTLYATLFYAGDYARSYAFGKEAAKAAPVNSDFLAMDAAMLGRMDEAAAAKKALEVLDQQWSVERLLTNFGNMTGETELNRLITGATKAGLRVCLRNDELAALPGAVQLKQCDAERAKG